MLQNFIGILRMLHLEGLRPQRMIAVRSETLRAPRTADGGGEEHSLRGHFKSYRGCNSSAHRVSFLLMRTPHQSHACFRRSLCAPQFDAPELEYTPPAYVSLLVTDVGILTPSAVPDAFTRLYSE